jgi:hypothetical protein
MSNICLLKKSDPSRREAVSLTPGFSPVIEGYSKFPLTVLTVYSRRGETVEMVKLPYDGRVITELKPRC